MRSFAHPSTHFEFVRSEAGQDDGHHVGEPTGEVRCVECGAVDANVDHIDHEADCPQTDVHSRWWAMRLAAD